MHTVIMPNENNIFYCKIFKNNNTQHVNQPIREVYGTKLSCNLWPVQTACNLHCEDCIINNYNNKINRFYSTVT